MILYALFQNSSSVTTTTSTRVLFAESYGYDKNPTVIINEATITYSSILVTDGTIIKDEPQLNYTINLS